MSSVSNISFPEQAEIRDYAKDLLAMCKKTVVEYGLAKTTLENLDKLRLKQLSLKNGL